MYTKNKKFLICVTLLAGINLCSAASESDASIKCGFSKMYVLLESGSLTEYSLKSEALRATECSIDPYPTGCISRDGRVIFLAGASRTARIWRIKADTFDCSSIEFPDMPAPIVSRYEEAFRPSVLLMTGKDSLLYVNREFTASNIHADNTVLLSVESHSCKLWNNVTIPATHQLRLSPDGRLLLVITNPIRLVDALTGEVLKVIVVPQVPTRLRKQDEYVLHGASVDWKDLTLYLWRTRRLANGKDVTEQAKMNINTGSIEILPELAPWPSEVFRYVDEVKEDFRSPLLLVFETFSGDLPARPILTLEQASAFARLKTGWINNLYLSKVYKTYLSPNSDCLVIVESQESQVEPKEGTETETTDKTYFSRILILDTHTGKVIKTIKTESPVSQVLMK